MDIISYTHKSEELLFQILGLIEVWTCRSMELSPVKRLLLSFEIHGLCNKLEPSGCLV
jgi:hypothetical protein